MASKSKFWSLYEIKSYKQCFFYMLVQLFFGFERKSFRLQYFSFWKNPYEMQKISSHFFSNCPFLGFKVNFLKNFKKLILKIEQFCITELSQVPLSWNLKGVGLN